MAGREPSISRRRVLGAAAAIPVLALPTGVIASTAKQSSSLAVLTWNARLARYQALATRARKAEETGWFRAANERWCRESADLGTDRKAAFARMTRAENLFWHRCTAPMQEAAVALVLTPPPDLKALGDKVTVIRVHQLYEPRSMERDCFEVLKRDVERLISLVAS